MGIGTLKPLTGAALAATMMALGATPSDAALTLSIDTNARVGAAAAILVQDNQPGDLSPLPGVIVWSGSLNNFDQVTAAGNTTVSTSSDGPAPATGFKLGSPPVYFMIDTTAAFSGNVRVCLTWAEGQVTGKEARVRLFHYENNAWTDVTDTSSVDVINNTVCGTTAGFSPFAIMEPVYPFEGFFQPIDNLPTVNSVKAGSAVPVKFSLGGFHGLDIISPGYPRTQLLQCDSSLPLAPVEETTPAGQSSLSYDSTTGRYVYVWKTDSAWAGSCRELQVLLDDGELYRARFSLRK